MASFLPTYIESRKGQWSTSAISVDSSQDLDSNDVALILAVFSIAQIFFAPLNTMVKNRIGSKNTIIFGFFLMTATTFGLGLIGLYDNPLYFKYTAIALRFF